MAEYAGYVRRETPIDWNSVAGDIVNQLGDVKKEQAAFREKYDKIAAETSAKIGEYEAGQSPQVNDLAYNMIADGRTTLAALHEKLKRREISPDAFNRAAMSMQTQNQEFKNMLSTYNTNVADIEKGIQEGGLSNLSNFQLEQYKDLSDLGNKRFQWSTNPNGITNLYVNTVDEDGNPVRQPMSLSVIRDMGNMRYAKYDLNGELLKSIKSLGIYDIKNIKDARNNPEYENFKNTLVESAVATDNQTASILADYGDYVPYKEGEPAPANGIEMVLQSNGQYEPKITPELKTKAREIINESIEARVGRTETVPEVSSTEQTKEEKRKTAAEQGKSLYESSWGISTGDFSGLDPDKYYGQINKLDKTIEIFNNKGERLESQKIGSPEAAESFSKYTKVKVKDPISVWGKQHKNKDIKIEGYDLTEGAISIEEKPGSFEDPPNFFSKIKQISKTDSSGNAQQKTNEYIRSALKLGENENIPGKINYIPVGDDLKITYTNPDGDQKEYVLKYDQAVPIIGSVSDEVINSNKEQLDALLTEMVTERIISVDKSKLVKRGSTPTAPAPAGAPPSNQVAGNVDPFGNPI
jgi:hypothetical protein